MTFDKSEGRQSGLLSFLRHAIHGAHRVGKVLSAVLQRRGGYRPVMNYALTVLKEEGWDGVKLRLGLLYALAKSTGYDRNDYLKWVRRYDTLTNGSRAILKERIVGLAHKPLISVLMRVNNPKSAWLAEAIESVRGQIYPHWELCIIADASTDKMIESVLERYAREDLRIKVVFRENEEHFSVAFNSALESIAGEWVALLDGEDLLSEHALFWVANAINQNTGARLIYSDEDKIDEAGRRSTPYFKCDWNVDLFYSHNLIGGLGVYQT